MEDEADEEEDLRNEVIMAVDVKEKDSIGCCYYEAREEKLYLMEDVRLGGLGLLDGCMSPALHFDSFSLDQFLPQ